MYSKHLFSFVMIILTIVMAAAMLYMVYDLLNTRISSAEAVFTVVMVFVSYLTLHVGLNIFKYVTSMINSEKIQAELDMERSFRKMSHKWERLE